MKKWSAMPTTFYYAAIQIGDADGGSTVAEARKFDNLDCGVAEIENSSRGEDQIKLQTDPERLYGTGWEDRTRWKNRTRRQCPVAAHHHQKSRHDSALRVCGKDGAWGQEDAALPCTSGNIGNAGIRGHGHASRWEIDLDVHLPLAGGE